MTINDFEDVRIGEHLKASGLLDGFTDINGQLKSAPALFYSEIDLTKLQANQRAVLIRQVGGITNGDDEIFYSQYTYNISVFGRKGLQDSGIVKGYAKQIRQWLLENYNSESQCIISISTRGVAGPFITDCDRRVYEISINARFDVDSSKYNS